MRTLVIHPEDASTDFLSVIYAGKDWTVITDGKVSKKHLKEQIKTHDRIVMLGHGTERGMEDMVNMRFLIDSSMVYLLKEKENVCIWCNANVFVEKYKLKDFYTGMIISEYEEAVMFDIPLATDEEIEESNMLFADAIKKSIDSKNSLVETKEKYYSDDNSVIRFNQENIFYS